MTNWDSLVIVHFQSFLWKIYLPEPKLCLVPSSVNSLIGRWTKIRSNWWSYGSGEPGCLYLKMRQKYHIIVWRLSIHFKRFFWKSDSCSVFTHSLFVKTNLSNLGPGKRSRYFAFHWNMILMLCHEKNVAFSAYFIWACRAFLIVLTWITANGAKRRGSIHSNMLPLWRANLYQQVIILLDKRGYSLSS